MRRFVDFDSDRYHTAVAASLICALVAGTFLMLASLAIGVDLASPAYYLGGLGLLVLAVKVAGWIHWGACFRWIRSRPWRSPQKVTTAYRWKKAPLPPPEEIQAPSRSASRSQDSTWQAFGDDLE